MESAIFLSTILTTAGSNDAQTVALQFLVLQNKVKLFAFVVAIRYDRTSPAEVLIKHFYVMSISKKVLVLTLMVGDKEYLRSQDSIS